MKRFPNLILMFSMLGISLSVHSDTLPESKITEAAQQQAAVNSEVAEKATPFIRFNESSLERGRTLWLDNCKGCHGYGIAGSPIPMEPDDWKARLEKGKDTLYQHAINGFFGPDDTMMPERGGNPALSDEEVKAAVDYVVALASHYIEANAQQDRANKTIGESQ